MKTWIENNQLLAIIILLAILVGLYYLVTYLMKKYGNKEKPNTNPNVENIHDINANTSSTGRVGNTNTISTAHGVYGTLAGQTRVGSPSAGSAAGARLSGGGIKH